MILTKLQGGLGNQLFQWAVSKNLSLIHETDYSFETSYFRLNAWGYELDKFKNIEKKFGNYQPPLTVITDDFHYKKIPNDSFLNGYWQSEGCNANTFLPSLAKQRASFSDIENFHVDYDKMSQVNF